MYPKHAQHENIANSEQTGFQILVDYLAQANQNDEMHAVQALSKLESCTIRLGNIKMLSNEEDRLLEVDETTVILKIDAQSAKLARALVNFVTLTKTLASFLAALPAGAAENNNLAFYNLSDALQELDEQYKFELHRALDRWKDCLMSVATQIQEALPQDFRAKCVETYDPDFVKNKILTQSLINSLGTDFVDASRWLKSLDKVEQIKSAFAERWPGENTTIAQAVADANDLTSTILSYNVLIYQFPKKTSEKRRQIIKDLKKKLSSKLGPKAKIPQPIMDRLTEAISGK